MPTTATAPRGKAPVRPRASSRSPEPPARETLHRRGRDAGKPRGMLRGFLRAGARVPLAAARASVPALERARQRAGGARRAREARRAARGGILGGGGEGLAQGSRRVLRRCGAFAASVGLLARQLARADAGHRLRARLRHRRQTGADDRGDRGWARGFGGWRQQGGAGDFPRGGEPASRTSDAEREGRRRHPRPRPGRRATLRGERIRRRGRLAGGKIGVIRVPRGGTRG